MCDVILNVCCFDRFWSWHDEGFWVDRRAFGLRPALVQTTLTSEPQEEERAVPQRSDVLLPGDAGPGCGEPPELLPPQRYRLSGPLTFPPGRFSEANELKHRNLPTLKPARVRGRRSHGADAPHNLLKEAFNPKHFLLLCSHIRCLWLKFENQNMSLMWFCWNPVRS